MYSLLLLGDSRAVDCLDPKLLGLRSSIVSLSKFSRVVLISRNVEHSKLLNDFPTSDFQLIPGKTAGALATAGYGLCKLEENQPFIVVPTNAQFANGVIEVFVTEMKTRSADVGAIVFQGSDPMYSYIRLGSMGQVIEVVEKEVTGSCALAGVYYFRDKSMFLKGLEWAMVNNVQVNQKFYISPMLNFYIAQGVDVSLFEITSESYLRLSEVDKKEEYEEI
jgi:hypothetical protein